METERIGFFLVPMFPMMPFVSAVEALRHANRLSNRPLYSWHYYSADGLPVAASNNMEVKAEHAIETAADYSTLFVCSGLTSHLYRDARVFAWLRRLAREGIAIGGLSAGSLLLARAGVLDGYRCTVHWERLERFAEEFPSLRFTDNLFEIDRDRYTCSGGTAALDLTLHLIARKHGQELAVAVSEQFLHDRVRNHHDHQRMALEWRLGVKDKTLLRAVSIMESHLEDPVRISDLARLVNTSRRHLERLFLRNLGLSPLHHYMRLRLDRARLLLRQTSTPIVEIAAACGFSSGSHLSRCFRERFGTTPSSLRRQSG